MRDDILSAPMERTSAGPRGGAVSIGTDNHRSDTDVMPTLARQGGSLRRGWRGGAVRGSSPGWATLPFLLMKFSVRARDHQRPWWRTPDDTTVTCRLSFNNKGRLLCILFRASGTRVLKAKGGADGDQISAYL